MIWLETTFQRRTVRTRATKLLNIRIKKLSDHSDLSIRNKHGVHSRKGMYCILHYTPPHGHSVCFARICCHREQSSKQTNEFYKRWLDVYLCIGCDLDHNVSSCRRMGGWQTFDNGDYRGRATKGIITVLRKEMFLHTCNITGKKLNEGISGSWGANWDLLYRRCVDMTSNFNVASTLWNMQKLIWSIWMVGFLQFVTRSMYKKFLWIPRRLRMHWCQITKIPRPFFAIIPRSKSCSRAKNRLLYSAYTLSGKDPEG